MPITTQRMPKGEMENEERTSFMILGKNNAKAYKAISQPENAITRQ